MTTEWEDGRVTELQSAPTENIDEKAVCKSQDVDVEEVAEGLIKLSDQVTEPSSLSVESEDRLKLTWFNFVVKILHIIV